MNKLAMTLLLQITVGTTNPNKVPMTNTNSYQVAQPAMIQGKQVIGYFRVYQPEDKPMGVILQVQCPKPASWYDKETHMSGWACFNPNSKQWELNALPNN